MVFALARDTHWTEKYILSMPISRALQYYHCALQAANLWTLEIATQESIAALVPESLTDYIAAIDDDDDDSFDL